MEKKEDFYTGTPIYEMCMAKDESHILFWGARCLKDSLQDVYSVLQILSEKEAEEHNNGVVNIVKGMFFALSQLKIEADKIEDMSWEKIRYEMAGCERAGCERKER